jgi:hypothetical protein
MEIHSQTITNLIKLQLLNIFPDIIPYSESVPTQALVFPHFFIYLINISLGRQISDTLFFIVLHYTVKYRYANEPTTISNLEQKLDLMAFSLMTDFQYLNTDEDYIIKLKNQNCEKADGELNFFFDIPRLVTREEYEQIKMGKLHLNVLLIEN